MIRIFFGSPGAGKTTHICKVLLQNKKKKCYDYQFCNFGLNKEYDLAHVVTSEVMKSLGQWTFPDNSYIAIDEAGIEYNNRKFKTFPQYTIEWFKLHRHYRCDVDVFSQSFEDMDITLRRLATQYWYMRGFGGKYGFTILRRCYKYVMVDDKTHQIIDGYRMESPIWILLQPLRLIGLGKLFPQLHGWKLTVRMPYYKYFDSYEHPDLPLLAFPRDGGFAELGSDQSPDQTGDVGAGSPGTLARRRIASYFRKILFRINLGDHRR